VRAGQKSSPKPHKKTARESISLRLRQESLRGFFSDCKRFPFS